MPPRKTREQKARDRAEADRKRDDKLRAALCARATRLWPALSWEPHPWRRDWHVVCAHVGTHRVVLACPPGSHTLVVSEGGDDSKVRLMVAGVDVSRLVDVAAREARAAGLPSALVKLLT